VGIKTTENEPKYFEVYFVKYDVKRRRDTKTIRNEYAE